MQKVIVLGGGMAGLTVAHELLERGYHVEIYEKAGALGGKARSATPPPAHPGGRPGLPNEHGFRFFPGFYSHIDDTMARIPTAPGANTFVLSHLVEADEITLARKNQLPFKIPAVAPAPGDFHGFVQALTTLLTDPRLGVPLDEQLFFIRRLICFLCSGHKRRVAQYDKISWSEFIGTAGKSQEYADVLANGLTRSLVAMQPEHGSTLTVGTILVQILLDLLNHNNRADRVLDGPTSEVWIEPWTTYLQSMAGPRLTINLNSEVTGFNLQDGRIQYVTVAGSSGAQQVGAPDDHFVAALPVEVMKTLLGNNPQDLKHAAGIADIDKLNVRWMNGVLFYLNKEVQAPQGHVIYLQSPWAITSIEQQDFWRHSGRNIAADYGDGSTVQILSTIVSEWFANGQFVPKQASQTASPDEIFEEVWEQVKLHRALWGEGALTDADRNASWLDQSISGFGAAQLTNAQPLLVNEIGSYAAKPEAVTQVANFFLASDYVHTNTDLATMEAANEAGRRAVIGILAIDDPAGAVQRPKVFELHEPSFLEFIKSADDVFFSLFEDDPDNAPPPAACLSVMPLDDDELVGALEEKTLLRSIATTFMASC